MKLTTFTHQGFTRIGVITNDSVVDLSRIAPDLPTDMVAFLQAGDEAMTTARSAAGHSDASIAIQKVRIEAPVLRPRKFLGIGANYPRNDGPSAVNPHHKDPSSAGHQIWFNKQVTCINGPFDPIQLPDRSEQVICETELALVIGKRCRNVAKKNAAQVIAGYLICNDVTIVDWVLRSPTATLGKSFDSHGPIGPWIVTADEIGNPHALGVRTYVNGKELQNGSTSGMSFDCFEMVAYLSEAITLEPGDILTTGTPSRVDHFLQPGDVVRCEVDGIGHIENSVIAES